MVEDLSDFPEADFPEAELAPDEIQIVDTVVKQVTEEISKLPEVVSREDAAWRAAVLAVEICSEGHAPPTSAQDDVGDTWPLPQTETSNHNQTAEGEQ